MADTTSKKLLTLLRPEQPGPVRRAAALVLGEIGPREKELAVALCEQLADPDPELRAEVTKAVGKLRIESALPQLVERVQAGGPEADLAAQAAACMGAKGIRALQDLMSKVPPGLRRRIAGAMGTGGTSTAENAAVETLLDSDPGVVAAATHTLIDRAGSLSAAERRAIADRALELVQPKKGARLPTHSEVALLRVLATLRDPRAEKIWWDRAEPPHAPELRAAALQALASQPPPTAAARIKRLYTFAADADFQVALPALLMLKEVSVSRKDSKDWLGLFAAPDVMARRLALEKLGDEDSPEIAEALMQQLKHPDAGLRKDALSCLAKLEHGRAALAEQLLEAASGEEAWQLARGQTGLARDYSAAVRTKLFNRACKYLEEGDRRADALLFLLREVDPRGLRDRLAERAVDHRKKKRYPAALQYLRILGRDPACGEALRFEQAACGLKLSSHDLTPAARAADPCLQQFARLVHNHDNPPLDYVAHAKWLEPEDLFFLGFHFIEGNGAERDFGAEVLRLLLKKSPRSKLARNAKTKLRSAGE